MGSKSHMEPYGFSEDLNAYLRKVMIDEYNRRDLSGRWLEEVTDKARSYDYWSKIIKGTRAMTTNDIQVIAEAFHTTPYDFVEDARDYAEALSAIPSIVNVRPHDEDYEISDDPGDEYRNAAETPRSPE